MNLRNKRPIFVPAPHMREIELLSKATLMDMAWDMAKQLTPSDDDGNEASEAEVMGTLRGIADVIKAHRRQA